MVTLEELVHEKLIGAIDVLNRRIELKLQFYATNNNSKVPFTDVNIHEPIIQRTPQSTKALLQYSGLAAWIMEFGSGSKMDTNSIYYDDYEMNPDRKEVGNAFVGRKIGEIVIRPDGTRYRSTGSMHGVNLEEFMHGKMWPLVPEPARHVISNEIMLWAQEVKKELKELIRRNIITQIKETVQK